MALQALVICVRSVAELLGVAGEAADARTRKDAAGGGV